MSMNTFLSIISGVAVGIPFAMFVVRVADHISGHRRLWGKNK